MHKRALEVFIKGGLWDEAREVVTSGDPILKQQFDASYVNFLKEQGKADVLLKFDLDAALDIFAERGKWNECLEKALGANPSSPSNARFDKYFVRYSRGLLENGSESDFVQLIGQIMRLNVPWTSASMAIYLQLCRQALHRGPSEALSKLREILFKLSSQLSDKLPAEFEPFVNVTHLLALKALCQRKKDLEPFAVKQAVSLLRYIDLIPADEAFYEAGLHAKVFCGIICHFIYPRMRVSTTWPLCTGINFWICVTQSKTKTMMMSRH